MDNNGGTSYGGGSYHEFTDFIDAKEIETVLELGSRDGLDAIWLSCIFDAVVYAWECHPGLKESMVSMTKHLENVHFVDKAVWSEETTIDFHIVTNGNVGASSCFEVDDSYIDQYLSNKIFKEHRDESSSCYVKDIDGNHIEFLKWPKKNG